MRTLILSALSVILLQIIGCAQVSDKETQVLARINDYELKLSDFEREFHESAYFRDKSADAKKVFLNNLIERKLILQDAQRRGLDKNDDFLKHIEKFWEQSLLKLALEKKSKDIAGLAFVSDKTIEEAYQKMFKEGRTDKAYDQMYNQIKWEVTKLKETKLMHDWMEALRKEAAIKVTEDLLVADK